MKMEPKATKQKKPRRRFTEEFKAGAVALVLSTSVVYSG